MQWMKEMDHLSLDAIEVVHSLLKCGTPENKLELWESIDACRTLELNKNPKGIESQFDHTLEAHVMVGNSTFTNQKGDKTEHQTCP